MNSKEENSEDFSPNYVQEIRPLCMVFPFPSNMWASSFTPSTHYRISNEDVFKCRLCLGERHRCGTRFFPLQGLPLRTHQALAH